MVLSKECEKSTATNHQFSSFKLSEKIGSERDSVFFVGTKHMETYDIVYILKYDARAYELRYSLRSIVKNLNFGKVWFVCGSPFGLKPDRHVSMIQRGVLKWQKARSSLLEVCKRKDLSDKFWLFNDDFFVLKPMESETPYFGGMLRDRILQLEHRYNDKQTGYSRELRKCEQTLKDADMTTFNYALHLPMLIDKSKMLEALQTFPDCPMFRSIYGNYAEIGGEQHDDVKITGFERGIPNDADFVSTDDASFFSGKVGRQIRKMFPEKCRFEI